MRVRVRHEDGGNDVLTADEDTEANAADAFTEQLGFRRTTKRAEADYLLVRMMNYEIYQIDHDS